MDAEAFPQTIRLNAVRPQLAAVMAFVRWLNEQHATPVSDAGDPATEHISEPVLVTRVTSTTSRPCPGPRNQDGVPSITRCHGGEVLDYRRQTVTCEACGGTGMLRYSETTYLPVVDITEVVLAHFGIDADALLTEQKNAIKSVHSHVVSARKSPEFLPIT